MNIFRIEISTRATAGGANDARLVSRLQDAGLTGVTRAWSTRLFFLDGGLARIDAERVARDLLVDPVTENGTVNARDDTIVSPAGVATLEILLRPGVMDPVAESTLAELKAEGLPVEQVRTARRVYVGGEVNSGMLLTACRRFLASDVIEEVVLGTAGIRPAPTPPIYEFKLRHAPIRALDDAGLEQLSRRGHLFLSLDEMRAIQSHYREQDREPTDLELETLAQTWSEHCVHKTLKSAVVYRGAAMPTLEGSGFGVQGSDQSRIQNPERTGLAKRDVEIRYGNLLKDTIARATSELMAQGRGPLCLSVFKDNAGVIAFDDEYGIAFKVETHNRPSAIEPYGGAATGVGGCIRDVLGCGFGARPIANTDVFCVAPSDWPLDQVPRGVLHPRTVLRGVVDGVGDYGNRMGIPTVNGAIHFDPRYLGNPLVFCGCVGLIPRDRIEKAARPGDLIVLIGGRTGRDGIHGATFSSAELTDSHADEFSHAVQIGNAITEKRVLDGLMRARDEQSRIQNPKSKTGCLYTAVTDCGAGGLSSAVGEMAAEIGAVVDLEKVPLKYAGLRYDEIWISEAQERMVLSVPPENLDALLAIMHEEEVEATVIGVFGNVPADARVGRSQPGASVPHSARLTVRYEGMVVGDMDMRFLHDGLPKRERIAEWQPFVADGPNPKSKIQNPKSPPESGPIADRLLAALRSPSAASKEWVIRRYDHEVQGGTVIKPLCGPGGGPADAAVLRPRMDSYRGIAIGCGLAPELSDIDPYWMAMAAIDEALNNVVCVGGDPARTAILDNFCWGRTDDPRQMGALVRACQACYNAAKAWGVPFISGKDSLNNEFALDAGDINEAIAHVRRYLTCGAGYRGAALDTVEERIRATGRLSIPGTLLISAVSLVDDVRRCVTADLKHDGSELYAVGRDPHFEFDIHVADVNRRAVAQDIRDGLIAACHDCSGGILPALAEMAIAGDCGVRLSQPRAMNFLGFHSIAGGFVVEVRARNRDAFFARTNALMMMPLGTTARAAEPRFEIGDESIPIRDLRAAWRGNPD